MGQIRVDFALSCARMAACRLRCSNYLNPACRKRETLQSIFKPITTRSYYPGEHELVILVMAELAEVYPAALTGIDQPNWIKQMKIYAVRYSSPTGRKPVHLWRKARLA